MTVIKDQTHKLSKVSVLLHWAVAIAMIVLIGMGKYMHATEAFFLYPLHKSLGMTALLLIVARILWRLWNGWLQPLTQSAWKNRLAQVAHWVLITGTLLMPVSGMMMSAAGGKGLHWFGLELIAANMDPFNPRRTIPLNETMAGVGHAIHHYAALVIIVFFVLHLVGALWHHFALRDGTLRRMLGYKV